MQNQHHVVLSTNLEQEVNSAFAMIAFAACLELDSVAMESCILRQSFPSGFHAARARAAIQTALHDWAPQANAPHNT